MKLSDNLNQLYSDSFLELMELLSFHNKTQLGYDLIEERHISHLKSMEEEIRLYDPNKKLASLENIRRHINIHKFPSLGEDYDKFTNTINKSIITYACSIFDNYLNQAIKYLLTAYPIKLSTEKSSIPYHEFILNSKETIIESLIEKEIYEFSYKRIDERIRGFSKRFDLDLEDCESELTFFSNKINLNKVTESFAIRNIIVHNKGAVNKTFLKLVSNTKYKLEELIVIDIKLIYDIVRVLINTISNISRQIEMRYY